MYQWKALARCLVCFNYCIGDAVIKINFMMMVLLVLVVRCLLAVCVLFVCCCLLLLARVVLFSVLVLNWWVSWALVGYPRMHCGGWSRVGSLFLLAIHDHSTTINRWPELVSYELWGNKVCWEKKPNTFEKLSEDFESGIKTDSLLFYTILFCLPLKSYY